LVDMVKGREAAHIDEYDKIDLILAPIWPPTSSASQVSPHFPFGSGELCDNTRTSFSSDKIGTSTYS